MTQIETWFNLPMKLISLTTLLLAVCTCCETHQVCGGTPVINHVSCRTPDSTS